MNRAREERAMEQRARTRRTGVLLGAAALACSQPAPPATLGPVTLTAEGGQRSAPARVARSIEVPADVSAWRVDAPRSRVVGLERFGLERGLYLLGEEPRELAIPGPFDPREFNQVALTLLVQYRTSCSLRLARAGAEPVSSGSIPLFSSPEPQAAVAGFAHNALRAEPFDELVLAFPRDAGPVCVVAIDLVQRPLADWQRPLDDDTRLAAVGTEARRATPISSRSALVGELAAPARSAAAGGGAVLRTAFALEPSLRFPDQEPRLALVLRAAGGRTLERSWPLEADSAQPARWHAVEVDLGPLATGRIEARFELRARGALPAFGWVADPRVLVSEPSPATVLLVTSDTHRGDHVGAANRGVAVWTPELDALAARGVLFEDCWSTTEITLPSHVALLTGRHPRDTRVVNNITALASDAPTLAEAFESAGYRTFAALSARHLGHAVSGLGQGFERTFAPEGEAVAATTVERLLGWLDEARGEPVFAWLHLFDAHAPYAAPAELEAPDVFAGEAEPPHDSVPPHVRAARARYRGEIGYLDSQLGRVLDLERVRDGVVAVTGDHGESLGTNGIFFTHEELYPATLRVPLILAWSDAPAGARVAGPVQHLGLGRTLLELAGIDARGFPGASLLAQVSGAAPPEPLFALAYGARSASITAGGMHLVLHLVPHPIGKPEPAWESQLHQVELYDLGVDPDCATDVVRARPADAARLRAALVAWLADARDPGWARAARVSEEQAAELAALGYATDGGAPPGAWIDPECECPWCSRF